MEVLLLPFCWLQQPKLFPSPVVLLQPQQMAQRPCCGVLVLLLVLQESLGPLQGRHPVH